MPYDSGGHWVAPHDNNGRTPESAARDATVAAIKARIQPYGYEALAPVRKASTPIPAYPVAAYDHRHRFLGVVARSRVVRSMPVAKAMKAQGPVTPCFDSAGQLMGVCDPTSLLGLAKGEEWSYDADGTLNGIIDSTGKRIPSRPFPRPPRPSRPPIPTSPTRRQHRSPQRHRSLRRASLARTVPSCCSHRSEKCGRAKRCIRRKPVSWPRRWSGGGVPTSPSARPSAGCSMPNGTPARGRAKLR
jgi:hypothetical protein